MKCRNDCSLVTTAFGYCVFHLPQEEERPEAVYCAICRAAMQGPQHQWDHDHATGEFRGWLCKNCNVGLGMFKDDPVLLERAAEYLRERTPV